MTTGLKIGILQPGHAPDEVKALVGDYPVMYERLLDGHGFTFRTWDVTADVFPDGPDDADGWLIGGSRHGVYEDLAWIARLEQLVRDIHAAGKPLIGVCFGHQIIAKALGGRVEKYSGGWAVGRTVYDFQGTPLALNAWHQDQVVELPDGAEVIASNDFCANAALAIGRKIFTVQPHPEYTPEGLEGLLSFRAETAGVPRDLVDAARARLDQPLDSTTMADRFAAFYESEAL